MTDTNTVRPKFGVDHVRSRVNVTSSGCWEWAGSRDREGYGESWTGGRRPAHRVVAELVYGPSLLPVLHSCDNPPCVRPDHLRYGTTAENNADMATRGRLVNPVGEHNGRARLTATLVTNLRDRRSAGESVSSLAKAFGISTRHVYDICDRRFWKHLDVVASGAVMS